MTPEELALRVDAFKAFRERRLELKREVDTLVTQESDLRKI